MTVAGVVERLDVRGGLDLGDGDEAGLGTLVCGAGQVLEAGVGGSWERLTKGPNGAAIEPFRHLRSLLDIAAISRIRSGHTVQNTRRHTHVRSSGSGCLELGEDVLDVCAELVAALGRVLEVGVHCGGDTLAGGCGGVGPGSEVKGRAEEGDWCELAGGTHDEHSRV